MNAPETAEQHPGGTPGAQTGPQAATDATVDAREPATDDARAAARFAADSKTHKLTAHREEGLYRHVEFTGLAGLSRIVLVTWPYNLIATGSHGSYHFERYGDDTEDMFNWLRGTCVNADSWASKLVNGRDSVTEYSRQMLVAEVNERVDEAIRDDWAPAGLKAAVHEQILNSGYLDEEQNALRMVDEFEHGVIHRAECSCGESADFDDYSAAVCWNAVTHKGRGDKHQVRIRQTGGFDFDDVHDWNIRKLNYHYLWTCHAMVWAVRQYDDARKAEPEFFQPGRTYEREHRAVTIRFLVDRISESPDGSCRVAFGWRTDDWATGWSPFDSDDFGGWTEVPAAEAVSA